MAVRTSRRPTCLAAAGMPAPDWTDGVNLLPYLQGELDSAPHETLYWRRSRLRTGALIVGVFVAIYVLNRTLWIGMASVAGPATFGHTAVANSILGGLTSLTLLVGSVLILARRRMAPSAT